MKFRWKRWTAGLVGMLAAYAALGFWGLPFLIERHLPRIAQGELARQASVGEVRFNPFTLRLEATDLRLNEADSAPLFGIGHLALQLEWRSILRRAWSFAEIRLAGPTANLRIASDGRFNLAELLDTIEQRRGADSGEAGLPRLVIERFALERGKLEMQDRQAGYENVFTPIDFALAHFSTLPDQNDSHTFSAESAHGGKLYWKGTASVNPIRASGELTLENASLPDLTVYLKSYARASITSGRLSASLPYSLSYAAGKFEARLAGAKLSVADLAVARAGPGDPFARLARLSVDAIDADLARREVTVGGVRGEAGQLRLARNAKGELDLAQLVIARAAASGESAPEPAAANGDWKLAVAQLVFDDIALSAVDETVKPALTLDAGKARLQLQL
ncbi:MAG: DUF748 domain-containing protein, partial [Ramlibacter sp.]|nr:DUF748 domain-containing protein [Ramlibacter sp.]